jgi:hypothetical protein
MVPSVFFISFLFSFEFTQVLTCQLVFHPKKNLSLVPCKHNMKNVPGFPDIIVVFCVRTASDCQTSLHLQAIRPNFPVDDREPYFVQPQHT